MWEIMLLVFAKQEHVNNIREPEIRTYRNGLFGMVGNKGGI
jgi:endonuclease/exonuclease/phosphatase family metal-dependent hydrolase